MLHNIDIAVVSECLCHLRAQYPIPHSVSKHQHIHMFLFVILTSWVFIVRIGIFWCAIWVYLKSLNGSLACDSRTQVSLQVLQRDSDTARTQFYIG